MRDARLTQVNDALLRKMLEQLDVNNLSVSDLVAFVENGHTANDTTIKVQQHRARRHNQTLHQQSLKEAQEARRNARKLKVK